jgi:hypothetical protein
MNNDEWIIAVARFDCEKTKDLIVNVYTYVNDLIGVKDLHFLIRDRLDDDVVVSFRISITQGDREEIIQYIASHLSTLISDNKYAINPEPQHPLWKYVAWSWKDRLNKTGLDTFNAFCGYLDQLSRMIVDMANNEHFDSKQRVEIAHLVSWMLGCTEYGQLSTTSWKIGYYDRICDQYHPLLEHALQSKE